jgi:hypothetical protein
MNCKALIALTTLLLTAWAGAAQAVTMQQWAEKYGIRTDASYDGTRVMETKDGQFSFTERKAPGKQVMGMDMGGMQAIVIMREDLNKAWAVMPEMGMYREMKIDQALESSADNMQVSKIEEVGREDVNGHSSRKFKTNFKDRNGKGAGFMWITDEGVPIKMDMIYKNRGMKGQRMKMELTELNMREQAAHHFELPEGLQPMNMGAMLGMARNMQKETGQNQQTNQSAGGQSRDPNLAEEVGEAAKDESERAVINETRGAIRKGIRGLFGN